MKRYTRDDSNSCATTAPPTASKPLVKVVLLDIEGTTTPISFVKDTLFPFVKNNIHQHITTQWSSDTLQDDIDLLRKQAALDKEQGVDVDAYVPDKSHTIEDISKAVISYVTKQMDQDRKVTSLKQLQGHIWEAGYEQQKLKGPVYPDVVTCFNKWKNNNIPIFIYSSGSIEAQKLLFKHSDQGDLLPYIAGHYDTTIGSKIETKSYQKIAAELLHYIQTNRKPQLSKDLKRETTDMSPTEPFILFVTDNPKEAVASVGEEKEGKEKEHKDEKEDKQEKQQEKEKEKEQKEEKEEKKDGKEKQGEKEKSSGCGFYTVLSQRPGNPPLDPMYESQFLVIQSFEELFEHYQFL